MDSPFKLDRVIFAGSLAIITLLAGLTVVFEKYIEDTTGYAWGKSDVRNYYSFIDKPYSGYFKDSSHYIIVNAFKITGVPIFIGFYFIFCMYLIFYLYFRKSMTSNMAVLSSFSAMFFTSYLAHSFYVCVWSQTLSFMFFMIMLVGLRYQVKSLEISGGLLAVLTHPLMSAMVGLYYAGYWARKRRKDTAYKTALYIVLFLAFSFFQYPFLMDNTRNIGLANINALAPSNDYEPPMFFILQYLLNPIMLGAALNNLNPVYWVFLLGSLFLHNGRVTMFFIPFMVEESVKRLKTKLSIIIYVFLNIVWFVAFNLEYFSQTYTFIYT